MGGAGASQSTGAASIILEVHPTRARASLQTTLAERRGGTGHLITFAPPQLDFPSPPTGMRRYIPVGLLEVVPTQLNWRPPPFFGRNDLETLMASENPADWIRISEMLLGRWGEGMGKRRKGYTSSDRYRL